MISNEVPFSTLPDAEKACTADTECRMIYDDECDGIGFHTCNGVSGDSASSCVYTKGTAINFNTLWNKFPSYILYVIIIQVSIFLIYIAANASSAEPIEGNNWISLSINLF